MTHGLLQPCRHRSICNRWKNSLIFSLHLKADIMNFARGTKTYFQNSRPKKTKPLPEPTQASQSTANKTICGSNKVF